MPPLRKKDLYWEVQFKMYPPFTEGHVRLWAPDIEKAIALAKSVQNLKEITSVTICGRE